VILERCQDAERQFYLERTKQFGWTKNVLIHQIENRTYEKTLLNQTNFDTALHGHIRNQAKLAVKRLGLAFSLPRFHWISSRRLLLAFAK
jgi:predicted nuclease of restriction endonuclease-like (RecB) superfamily